MLFCGEYYEGSETFSYIWIGSSGQTYESRFSYYARAGNALAFSGSAQIYGPTFNSESSFAFSDSSGQTNESTALTRIAQLMFCSSIDFANYLFTYYVNPTGIYNIGDFGFSNN